MVLTEDGDSQQSPTQNPVGPELRLCSTTGPGKHQEAAQGRSSHLCRSEQTEGGEQQQGEGLEDYWISRLTSSAWITTWTGRRRRSWFWDGGRRAQGQG